MHQSFEVEPIVARFTFLPDRAHEFLGEEDPNTGKLIYNGQLVTQIDCVDIDEVMEYATQFSSALVDASAIVNGKVVSLSDFPQEG